jgi:hypothetical protein
MTATADLPPGFLVEGRCLPRESRNLAEAQGMQAASEPAVWESSNWSPPARTTDSNCIQITPTTNDIGSPTLWWLMRRLTCMRTAKSDWAPRAQPLRWAEGTPCHCGCNPYVDPGTASCCAPQRCTMHPPCKARSWHAAAAALHGSLRSRMTLNIGSTLASPHRSVLDVVPITSTSQVSICASF